MSFHYIFFKQTLNFWHRRGGWKNLWHTLHIQLRLLFIVKSLIIFYRFFERRKKMDEKKLTVFMTRNKFNILKEFIFENVVKFFLLNNTVMKMFVSSLLWRHLWTSPLLWLVLLLITLHFTHTHTYTHTYTHTQTHSFTYDLWCNGIFFLFSQSYLHICSPPDIQIDLKKLEHPF